MLRYTIINLVPELANNSEFNTIFWLGKNHNEMVMDSCPKYLLIFETFRYIIWKKKLARKIPNPPQVLRELALALLNMAAQNRTVELIIFDNNLLARCKQALG